MLWNTITVWCVITGLKAAIWTLSLIYNDHKHHLQHLTHSQCLLNGVIYQNAVHRGLFTTAKETLVDFFLDIRKFNSIPKKWVEGCIVLRWRPVDPKVSLCRLLFFRTPSPPFYFIFVHSELGEAAESMSSFSRSLGEDDCPPFTLFHFILLFWNHTFTCHTEIQKMLEFKVCSGLKIIPA